MATDSKASTQRSGSGSRKSTQKAPQQSARSADGTGDSKKLSPSSVASSAAEQLSALTGRSAESVTSLERGDDGWTVGVEVVESRRIPDSTDILALYQVDVDASAELRGYRRVRRYPRGRGGED